MTLPQGALVSAVLLTVLLVSVCDADGAREECHPRKLNSTLSYTNAAKSWSSLDLYVFNGMRYQMTNLFVDVMLSLNLSDQNTYQIYQGSNCSSVLGEHSSDQRLFGLLKSVNIWRSLQLNPFNATVIGIDTNEPYEVSLRINSISIWRLVMFVCAIMLFLLASGLVRNALFYYSAGCSIGLLTSLLFVVFIVYRMAPKKMIGVPILLGGWSVSVWMFYTAWHNFSSILLQYQKFVAAYFVSVVLISLAYCYKKGPPTDARSHDLAQWALQGIALVLIYASSQVPEVSFTVMAVLIVTQLLQSSSFSTIFSALRSCWRYFYPERRRLLTRDEYEREAVDYTRAELDRLRAFCRSPDANTWKLAQSVRNPKRCESCARPLNTISDDDDDEQHSSYLRDRRPTDRTQSRSGWSRTGTGVGSNRSRTSSSVFSEDEEQADPESTPHHPTHHTGYRPKTGRPRYSRPNDDWVQYEKRAEHPRYRSKTGGSRVPRPRGSLRPKSYPSDGLEGTSRTFEEERDRIAPDLRTRYKRREDSRIARDVARVVQSPTPPDGSMNRSRVPLGKVTKMTRLPVKRENAKTRGAEASTSETSTNQSRLARFVDGSAGHVSMHEEMEHGVMEFSDDEQEQNRDAFRYSYEEAVDEDDYDYDAEERSRHHYSMRAPTPTRMMLPQRNAMTSTRITRTRVPSRSFSTRHHNVFEEDVLVPQRSFTSPADRTPNKSPSRPTRPIGFLPPNDGFRSRPRRHQPLAPDYDNFSSDDDEGEMSIRY